MSGERCRGLVKNAKAVKSIVVVNTFRCPLTNAPPKLVSRKYFCASSQLISERAGGVAGQLSFLGSGGNRRSGPGKVSSSAHGGSPGSDRIRFEDGTSVALQFEVL